MASRYSTQILITAHLSSVKGKGQILERGGAQRVAYYSMTFEPREGRAQPETGWGTWNLKQVLAGSRGGLEQTGV